jgi:hypothetical protein
VSTVQIDLEQSLEAEDGVVEVALLRPHLDLPWAVVEPGPRRWAPTDLWVGVSEDGRTVELVRMTYRTVGDRSVVVAALRPGADVDAAADKLATPLLFAHLRRVHADAPVASIVAAMDCTPTWDEQQDGWRTGHAGVGERPVRLAHLAEDDGHVLIAMHGVAEEEAATILRSLVRVTAEDEAVLADLHTRHRQALAQRWWDAPRVPWTPTD